MHLLKFVALLTLVILAGCVHINEGSRSANLEQIKAHLKRQLHCQALDLQENTKNTFSGTGRNDTGGFTITATREKETIIFHGVYVYSEPSKGTFSGSAIWSKQVNSAFGFHKSKESAQDSLGTP
jgi:hypothetical protein